VKTYVPLAIFFLDEKVKLAQNTLKKGTDTRVIRHHKPYSNFSEVSSLLNLPWQSLENELLRNFRFIGFHDSLEENLKSQI